MNMLQAITTCIKKFAVFRGRASRAEFWYYELFVTIVSVLASIIDEAIWPSSELGGAFATAVVFYGLLLPNTAVYVRRLHDTNRSGWWCVPLFVLGFFFQTPQGIAFSIKVLNAIEHINEYGLALAGLIGVAITGFIIVQLIWLVSRSSPGRNRFDIGVT